MAQIADRRTSEFYLNYYSIGVGDPYRLASYFILDVKKRPELPGAFDWQAPVTLKSIEEFFGLTNWNKKKSRRIWNKSKNSFKTVHHVTLLFRQSDARGEYVGADVRSTLHEYLQGSLIGGLPFGAEDKFLAICRPDKDIWPDAFESHRQLFSAWNVICGGENKLTRVFIEGDPGSGKELWYEAIKLGSSPHRDREKWKTVSATTPIAELKLLLYGEQSGALERPGFLTSCAGGGVFLDEIGKADPLFRKDLLRVLEAKEFVPIGGLPTTLDDVLFLFASTRDDRERASDPPDFWTRMDAELVLPVPIKLRIASHVSPFNPYDEARFYALLSHFWVDALKTQMKGRPADERSILQNFDATVFTPTLNDLIKAVKNEWSGGLKEISVSPRRIRSLAFTLASEHQWIGYPVREAESEPPSRETAEKSYADLRRRFVKVFFSQLVQDEGNVQEVKKETESRRRRGLGLAHES